MGKPKPKVAQLLDARGRTIIERRGTRPSSIADDAYHLLRTTTWPRALGLFVLVFLLSNVVFAVILYFGHAKIANSTGFMDCFWFSVQSMGTIGYGYLAPEDNLANTVVTVETVYSIFLTALVTGMFFARFSTPSARVLFSNVALISRHDGQRVLQFRMANERTTAIVEATVHAYITREEKLESGETMRRVYDLKLRRQTSPVFALSFLVVHPIDEGSPLYNVTPESLLAGAINVIVTFTGIDDQLATNVHARYVWGVDDIKFDHRFADLFKIDAETGARYLDLAPMHDIVPLDARPVSTTSPP
ncbi:MAG: ion channel [Kofleriaceae bacterium]